TPGRGNRGNYAFGNKKSIRRSILDLQHLHAMRLRALFGVDSLFRINAEDALAPRPWIFVGGIRRVAVHVSAADAPPVIAALEAVLVRVLFVVPRSGIARANKRRDDRLTGGSE